MKPVSEYSFVKPVNKSITYKVRKDNVVLYKSNRYRVPKGTYHKGKKVYIIQDGNEISIVDAVTGEVFAIHPLCMGKGELIGSSSRENRDMSQSVKELDASVKALFFNSEETVAYLDRLHVTRRRYYRDQLLEIQKMFRSWDAGIIQDAVRYCFIQRQN